MNQKLYNAIKMVRDATNHGWVKKVKANWQLIIVAIIVAGVSLGAYSKNSSLVQKQQENQQENIKTNEAGNTENSNFEIAKAKEPETHGADAIKETAEKGEGVTHLARRAIKEYLQSNNETLSSEQKIYLEDYLKRKIGSKPLEIGQTIEFETGLIKTGLEKSKTLSHKQIENLSKYVPLAKNLN
ncbi:hypothetical protein KKG29_00110 [Patescibacteria group bacterium]|nr:hypothetical protein [Patescibacteria group bacterium]MBU3999573.1 hypothetical protein [Patescibacteria group bacterium]MBU4056952.1 hypothetical protein [Patescibacteria group bacterium]MBU4368816.1 hypothetical protein [Patescibacteria group bacterium]